MGNTRIHRRDATALGMKPAGLGAPFDLAFIDPPYYAGVDLPYRRDQSSAALARLADGGWLAADAIAVVERAQDEPEAALEGFRLEDERRYGAAKIRFLRRAADA
jgi:16S rRNA (guanine966-N2)-methyltransferase